jgi:hypothetical protein
MPCLPRWCAAAVQHLPDSARGQDLAAGDAELAADEDDGAGPADDFGARLDELAGVGRGEVLQVEVDGGAAVRAHRAVDGVAEGVVDDGGEDAAVHDAAAVVVAGVGEQAVGAAGLALAAEPELADRLREAGA